MHTIDTLTPPGLFRTSRTAAAPVRVDRVAKVIFGASLMQVGDLNPADSRFWTVTPASLQQALKLSVRSASGLKARFTHPNMSSDGMGSYLGRWRNLRIDGDTLRGDLHIAAAASTSPQGDLATYVLDMAEGDPEAFGVSLATVLDETSLAAHYDAQEKMEGADTLAPSQRWPMAFSAIRAGDIVDEPAATTGGLFDLNADLRNLPAQATALVDTYFGTAAEDVVRGRINAFLDRYFSTKGAAMTAAATIETGDTAPLETDETTPVVTSDDEVAPVVVADTPDATPQTDGVVPAVTEAPLQTSRTLGDFMDAFGDAEGARLFRAGVQWDEASAQHLAACKGQIQDLQAENLQLKSKVAQLAKGQLGEDAPLSLGQNAPKKPKSFGEACRNARQQK